MSSLMSDVHGIVVALSDSDLTVEPGSSAQLVVTMTNRQIEADRLSLEVEGLDVEWYAIPVPAVNVPASAQVSERILFKVARSSANRAGTYPFLVRVQAMETGEVGVAQATLVVRPFKSLQIELDPKRAVATFFHPLNDFDVAVTNIGNSDEALDLYASDPDEGCAYEFDQGRVIVKPGQTQSVPLTLRPKTSSVLGRARLYGFTVTARSVDDSYVSANVHGQIEKHPLISTIMGVFMLLAVLGLGSWFAFRPQPVKPPVLRSFTAVPARTLAGGEVTLSWDADNFQQIIIRHHIRDHGQNSDEVIDGPQQSLVGHCVVTPSGPETVYTIVVRGRSGQKDLEQSIPIDVDPAPTPPKPALTYFKADPPVIHPGDSVQLSWDGHDYSQAIIDPGNMTLSQFAKTQSVTPDQDQSVYTLRVIGANNQVDQRKVTVQVVPKDQSIAHIDFFGAKPAKIYIGDKAHLKWHVSYARTVHLSSDVIPLNNDVRSVDGIDETLTVPTTFTLTATDSADLTKTQTFVVTPVLRPAPPVPQITQPSPGGTAVPGAVTPPTPTPGPTGAPPQQ